ncbi:NmrA family NAD(P)-binding protein [Kibdelosporangium aridum]|uniref:NmrA family NAD(P)-binding protein n=1 Tax=Kibdelosporangium aridum TaxID=2030 RepID=UPI000524C2BC
MPKILVLGGTGKTGRRVAAGLRDQGLEPRVVSRSTPDRFDWADEATWAPVLRDISAVYVVDEGTDRLPEFTELAVKSGVQRLVLLAARVWQEMGADLTSEQTIEQSGVDWTILRPTWFNQNFTEDPLLADPVKQGEVRLPTGDGKEAFIDAQDIADVAIAALTQPGHAGKKYDLSGPRLLTWGDAVDEIARATGRKITYVPVDRQAYTDDLSERGYPPEYAEVIVALFDHIREHRSERLSDGVQQVLGREPRDFREYAKTIR